LIGTEGFQDPKLRRRLRWAGTVISPLNRFFTVPREESGERAVFLISARGTGKSEEGEIATASDAVVGGGAYRVH
jgi:hypothetical protein